MDHSIGLLMLERAEAALDTNTAVGRQTAEAIVTDDVAALLRGARAGAAVGDASRHRPRRR